VVLERRQNLVGKRAGGRSAPATLNSSVRTREYLTTAEIERLMAAARKSSRHGHRDTTMILIGYRHGLGGAGGCGVEGGGGRGGGRAGDDRKMNNEPPGTRANRPCAGSLGVGPRRSGL